MLNEIRQRITGPEQPEAKLRIFPRGEAAAEDAAAEPTISREAWSGPAQNLSSLVEHRREIERLAEERTAELTHLNENLQQEIAERKRAELLLETACSGLEEVNTALKILLRQKEKEKKDLEERFLSNVKELVLPYLENIKRGHLDDRQALCVNIIETNLNEILSPILQRIKQLNLSPRETQILSLIKDGKKTKEIAEIIGVASSSIDTHRNNIRAKLHLNKKKVSLRSYLQVG